MQDVAQAATAAAVAATFAAAGPAAAAQEVATLAAGDGRLSILLSLFVPALGWVAFNMAQPVANQISAMTQANANKAPKARKGRAAAVGLGLTAASVFAAAQSADAATEFATIAAGDNRPALFLALFAPALIWVGINIAGPALNQLNAMSGDKPSGGKKGGRR